MKEPIISNVTIKRIHLKFTNSIVIQLCAQHKKKTIKEGKQLIC